jgi:pentatricopeptide repeat protein
VYARLKLARAQPNHLFFSTLLQCCLEQKSFEAGIQVLQDMRDHGYEPYAWIVKRFIEKNETPIEVGVSVVDWGRHVAR